MDWIADLSGQIVGLDTAPIIYFIEEDRRYLDAVRPFFEAMERGDFQVVTSTVTLVEVLVQPIRLHRPELARKYRDILLSASNLKIIPVSSAIAEKAAELRGKHGLRTPDAIQLGTALHEGAAGFLTNDSRLKVVRGIQVLTMDEILKAER